MDYRRWVSKWVYNRLELLPCNPNTLVSTTWLRPSAFVPLPPAARKPPDPAVFYFSSPYWRPFVCCVLQIQQSQYGLFPLWSGFSNFPKVGVADTDPCRGREECSLIWSGQGPPGRFSCTKPPPPPHSTNKNFIWVITLGIMQMSWEKVQFHGHSHLTRIIFES